MEYEIKREVSIAISFSKFIETEFNDMLLLLMKSNDEEKYTQFCK